MKQIRALGISPAALLMTVALTLGACEPGGEVGRIESALGSGIIDNFDDGDVSDWSDFAGAGSSISHALSKRASSGTASLKVAYAIADGGYAGLEKIFASPVDWSASDGLTVWVYGLGTGHPLTVQIYDSGLERWQATGAVTWMGWQLVTMPFNLFTRSACQPPEAVQNGLRDFAAVKGMALLPATAGMKGTVYLDSLGLFAGGATSPPPSPPPLPPPPPTPSAGLTGTIVPLYTYPTDSSWAAVITAKTAHPTVPVMAIVNPSNGPAARVDSAYTTGIGKLVAAGVKVLGYVYTSYAARPTADVEADIDRWRSFYPQVSGIFFDEQTNTAGNESHYRELSDYAKSTGVDFSVGNPGTDSSPSYVGTVDVILIYESGGLPGLASLAGWHTSFDKQNFGIIPYDVSAIDDTFIQTARQEVGYIYVQNDKLPNPWDSVPSYFGSLLDALAR